MEIIGMTTTTTIVEDVFAMTGHVFVFAFAV
jgi:hypothetical protein